MRIVSLHGKTQLLTADYKKTSSIRRKAIEIEAVLNLQSDGEVGKVSLIISNLLLKQHLEAVKVRVLSAISSDYQSVDAHIVNIV
jgi:hypothetical protein